MGKIDEQGILVDGQQKTGRELREYLEEIGNA